MTHWARNARNKAMGDKKKAGKQGAAIVAMMRRDNELKGKDSLPIKEGMEGVPGEDTEGSGPKV